jgi:hypothetical protein
MRHWNLLSSFRGLPARRYSMNGMKNFSRIISIATMITNTNRHILKNHKAISVLECLTLDKTRLNRSFAVLALVSAHKIPPLHELPYRIAGVGFSLEFGQYRYEAKVHFGHVQIIISRLGNQKTERFWLLVHPWGPHHLRRKYFLGEPDGLTNFNLSYSLV